MFTYRIYIYIHLHVKYIYVVISISPISSFLPGCLHFRNFMLLANHRFLNIHARDLPNASAKDSETERSHLLLDHTTNSTH